MDIKYVKRYFKKWAAGSDTPQSKCNFVQMLQGKTICARRNNVEMFAFDRMHKADSLEKMLVIADDNL